jgi:hypothetical protein
MNQPNLPAFFEAYRREFGALRVEQVPAIERLLGFMRADQALADIRDAAYMLATVKHETADTFEPVREAFWKTEDWRKRNLRYAPWYGRGYVQLTWERNYRRAGEALDLDLTSDPDVVMEPGVAYQILALGMRAGWFTGKRIGDYVTRTRTDYLGARKVINGSDRDAIVAAHAARLERCLGSATFDGPRGF